MKWVRSEGDLFRPILFIGESPGQQEVIYNRPFCGPAGKKQDQLNALAGISREQARWTNVIKVRPPNDDISHYIDLSKKPNRDELFDWLRGRLPFPPKGISPDSKEHLLALLEEIDEFRGNVIVPLGNVPMWVLTGNVGITKWRGSILSYKGRKVIPCVHPSSLLRGFDKGDVRYSVQIRLAIADLRRVAEESLFPEIRLPVRDLIIYPTAEEALLWLRDCLQLPEVGFDIEAIARGGVVEMSCFAVAANERSSMCIPLISNGRNYFSEEEEIEILDALDKLLGSWSVKKVGHNIIFDSAFLYRRYGMICLPVEDTMIAHMLRFPDVPRGLDTLVRLYTREPYYKDDGKEWNSLGKTEAAFFEYNAKDAAVVLEILPKVLDSLRRQDGDGELTDL